MNRPEPTTRIDRRNSTPPSLALRARRAGRRTGSRSRAACVRTGCRTSRTRTPLAAAFRYKSPATTPASALATSPRSTSNRRRSGRPTRRVRSYCPEALPGPDSNTRPPPPWRRRATLPNACVPTGCRTSRIRGRSCLATRPPSAPWTTSTAVFLIPGSIDVEAPAVQQATTACKFPGGR